VGLRLEQKNTKHQAYLIELLKSSPHATKVAFAYLDAMTEQYYPIGVENGFIQYGLMELTTNILNHWMPDIPWASVFGPEYIQMFGMEKLLAAPAYCVEQLSDDAIFMQLTGDMNDLFDEFKMVMTKREQIKHYLGYDCFYQKEMNYYCKNPADLPSETPYRVRTFRIIDAQKRPY
jgi:hypothetical protein